MPGAGKGDTYRPCNKKVSDESHERIFGKKEPTDFQKCNKYLIPASKKESNEKT